MRLPLPLPQLPPQLLLQLLPLLRLLPSLLRLLPPLRSLTL